jgi:uncharacterized protein YbjT (DUF2867 family)
MKIVIMGGSGRVGANLVDLLSKKGVTVSAASRRTGVDAVTGAGLDAALAGADIVVDELNSPSFEDEAALRFFETATSNLLAAEAAAGVGQHIALRPCRGGRAPPGLARRLERPQGGAQTMLCEGRATRNSAPPPGAFNTVMAPP